MEANGEVTKIDNRMQLVFCILPELLKKVIFRSWGSPHWVFFLYVFFLLNLPATLRLSIHTAVHPSVRLLVRPFFVSSLRSLVRLLICSFVHLLVGSFVRSFARSLFVRSLFFSVPSFVRSFACLFACPCVRSLARSFIYSPTFLNISHHSSILRPVSPLLLPAAIAGKTKQTKK